MPITNPLPHVILKSPQTQGVFQVSNSGVLHHSKPLWVSCEATASWSALQASGCSEWAPDKGSPASPPPLAGGVFFSWQRRRPR